MSRVSHISMDQMRLVLEVSRQLVVTTELDPLLGKITDAATQILSAERASIFLHDASADQLWAKVATGNVDIRIPSSAGIAGHVFQSNQLLNIPDAYADERFNRDVDKSTGYRTRNLLTAPMVDLERRAIGVLQAINRIGGPFGEIDEMAIQILADQAGVAIQRYRLQQAAVQSESLRREMDLARQVQQATIPQTPPKIPGLQAAGWTRAASITGGDSFDLWRLSDGRLGILLADASGHGLGAALVVSQVRSLVRTLCEMENDPDRLLQRIHLRMAEDLEVGRFITVFLGLLDGQGALSWASAGHGPILVRGRGTPTVRTLQANRPPVGVLTDLPPDLPEPVRLEPDGWLVVLSDGIVEAGDRSAELFGTERVVRLLEQFADQHPQQFVAAVCEAAARWEGHDDPLDDQTIVAVRRHA